MEGSLSFEETYQLYAGQILRYCITQLRDPHIAEDIAASTFASAYSSFAKAPKDRDGIRPWLFRIARNAIIDHRRHENRWRALYRILGHARETPSVEATASLRAELRVALEGISKLRRRDREMVGLRLGGRLPVKEIADMFGMSEVATRTAINRALARLRDYVEDNS